MNPDKDQPNTAELTPGGNETPSAGTTERHDSYASLLRTTEEEGRANAEFSRDHGSESFVQRLQTGKQETIVYGTEHTYHETEQTRELRAALERERPDIVLVEAAPNPEIGSDTSAEASLAAAGEQRYATELAQRLGYSVES